MSGGSAGEEDVRSKLARHREQAGTSFLESNKRPTVRGPLFDASNSGGSANGRGTAGTDAGASGAAATYTGDTFPVAEVQVVLDDGDVEQQLEWQRQRVAERLSREGRRVDERLGALVADSLSAPVQLQSIRVLGARTLRPSFVRAVFDPYLASLGHIATVRPTNLEDVLRASKAATQKLYGLDVFQEVDALLEASRSVLASPGDVDLVFRVREQGRYFLRTATDVGDGEGSATATARVRNAFGGAELLEATVGFGTKTRSNLQIRAETPLRADPNRRLELSCFAMERDYSQFASCRERLKGALLRFKTSSSLGHHDFAWETTARRICELGPNASISVRDLAGHSVKSSISHALTRDTRDDAFAPTSGSRHKLVQEYAGLGGDAHFWRADSESILSRALGRGYVGSLGLRTGLVVPLDDGRPLAFSDRLHLGGPTSVRMFRINSLGPRDNGDYVGGQGLYALGASLLAPIPRKEHWPLKLHAFINAGQVTGGSSGASWTALLRRTFAAPPSASVGFGLMYRHAVARIELNVGVPLAAYPSDGARTGLQFGVGLNFVS